MKSRLTDSKFMRQIEKKVNETIKKYKMFSRKDKIGVAVSGGKDSTVCLHILKKLGYDVEAITVDAVIGDYTKENIKNLKKVCKENDIKLKIVSFRDEFGMALCYIQSLLKGKGHNYSSCKICGILRRYLLNKHAKRLKFGCLATGHNLDDESQAVLMNLLRNDLKLALRIGPVSGMLETPEFVKRVKPMYFVPEEDVIRYSRIMKFPVKYGICPCSVGAYRRKHKNFLDEFEKKHPSVKYNIVKMHERMLNLIEPKRLDMGKVNRCRICGEPAAKDMCGACRIFKELKIVKK
ncbi:TIGR00269 family protein [Candidatus Woesearchaeota archaeon]|nr:TIGR00269 family protein [Candidatus Woesearchaeota archaeon]